MNPSNYYSQQRPKFHAPERADIVLLRITSPLNPSPKDDPSPLAFAQVPALLKTSSSLERRPRDPRYQLQENPLVWGVLRTAILTILTRRSAPISDDAAKSSGRGHMTLSTAAARLRIWAPTVALSSVDLRADWICVRARAPSTLRCAYWRTATSIKLRGLEDGRMRLCGGCTTRMSETECVSKWLGERELW